MALMKLLEMMGSLATMNGLDTFQKKRSLTRLNVLGLMLQTVLSPQQESLTPDHHTP